MRRGPAALIWLFGAGFVIGCTHDKRRDNRLVAEPAQPPQGNPAPPSQEPLKNPM